MRLLCGLCCLLAIVVAPVVSLGAAAAEDLFQVAVPVVSQSSTERAQAASLGLRKVILRMAGSPSAVDTDVVHQAYSQAQNFIEQFHYEPYTPHARDQENAEATELLVMTFSKRIIEQLLRDAGQAYWPPNRPPVLVWLVEDTSQGKMLVNSLDAEAIQGLRKGARERGLEIQLPLLDLEDQLALPAKRLWRLDEEAILAASERYRSNTILVGRYSQTSRGEWLSTWQFLHRGANREYDLRTDTAYDMGQRAIQPFADYLASLYAVALREDGSPQLALNVTGIDQFGDYRGVLDYLSGLAGVSDVDLQAVRGDTLLLQLRVDGGVDTLRNALSLDKKLKAVQAAAVDANTPPWLRAQAGTLEQPLAFVWMGR